MVSLNTRVIIIRTSNFTSKYNILAFAKPGQEEQAEDVGDDQHVEDHAPVVAASKGSSKKRTNCSSNAEIHGNHDDALDVKITFLKLSKAFKIFLKQSRR